MLDCLEYKNTYNFSLAAPGNFAPGSSDSIGSFLTPMETRKR